MMLETTEMEGLLKIKPFVAQDERGTYVKNYAAKYFFEHEINFVPKEAACTYSNKGVLRGLHFQYKYSQPKLVRVIAGEVFDVVIDLRKNSATFGKWKGFYLSSESDYQIYIPAGFAQGSLATQDNTILCYESGDDYHPEFDTGIAWDDPDININWPLSDMSKLIISEKDKNLPTFKMFCDTWGGIEKTQ